MKKFIFLLLLFFYSSHPPITLSHGIGLPPFLTINGKETVPNTLDEYGYQSDEFIIPHEQGAEYYVLNEPIRFIIDTSKLEIMIAKEILNETRFYWEFGDGDSAEGTTVTHSYKKIGSYLPRLTISFKLKGDDEPVKLIDDILIHIVPHKNFNDFPNPVIKLNGKQTSKNPLENVETVNFTYPLVFDAQSSKNASSMTEFLWNFGDGTVKKGSLVTHQYNDQFFQTVVLRITDKNGFIADTYVGLRNNPEITNTLTTNPQSKTNAGIAFIGIILIVIMTGLIVFLKKKKNPLTRT